MRTYNFLKTLTIISVLFFPLYTYCEEGISQKEQIIIHDKAFKLVESYQNMINQIGEDIADVDKTKSNIELFIDLYVNRKTLVYNDLDPAHALSEYYEVETYISNLSLWYPDGQEVLLDMKNARVSNIIDHGDKIYTIDVAVDKKINGNYLNKTVNTNDEKLLFRIAFTKENMPVNFKIAGVRNAAGGKASFDNSSLTEVKSADFTADQVAQVKQYCVALLNDYTNYLALLGNPDESDDDKAFYKEAITGIFAKADNNLYNDLEQDAEDKYLGIEDYIASYTENYPVINNISLNTDSAKFGKPIKNEDGLFYIETHVDKFFSGKLKGKNLYRSQDRLIFKIKFAQKGESFADFIIESVDDESLNQALLAGSQQSQDISEFSELPKLTRKGWYIGASVNTGIGQVYNKNIADLTMEKEYHEWEIKPSLSFGGKATITYMFNNFLGFETGLGYQYIKTIYSISSEDQTFDPAYINISEFNSTNYSATGFVDPTLYSFISTDQFRKIIQLENYDSTLTISNICIPLYLNTIIGKNGKISCNFKIGLNLNYSISTNYQYSFTKNDYFIHYPNPIGSAYFIYYDDLNKEDFGLYEILPDEIEPKTNDDIKKFYIDGVIGLGLEIPLGYFFSITVDGVLKSSIVDLSTNTDPYVDIFGRTEPDKSKIPNHVFDHQPTHVRSVLLEVGVKYKL